VRSELRPISQLGVLGIHRRHGGRCCLCFGCYMGYAMAAATREGGVVGPFDTTAEGSDI
jgi:hypothetical protein